MLPQNLFSKKQESLTTASTVPLVLGHLRTTVVQTVLPTSLGLTSRTGWEKDNPNCFLLT